MANSPKTIFFLGATGGCGFSALRRSLEAGHVCIALCRTPSKLSDRLPKELQANLRLEQGNARDAEAIARCLANPANPSALVDMIFFTLGGAFQPSKMGNDDPNVCERAMASLLEALAQCRASSVSGSPRLAVISSTGITALGRDVPLLMLPMYKIMLKEPHKDKKAMEDALIASGEDFTLIRPSFLVDHEDCDRPIRAGLEDPIAGKVESQGVGYTISREAVGKWMYQNLVQAPDTKWSRKVATITF